MDFIIIIAKCGYPMINSPVEVVGYSDNGVPVNVGTTVNFICPPDLSLTGTNSTTCTGNEEWKPDPSVVMCTKGNKLASAWFLINSFCTSGQCIIH